MTSVNVSYLCPVFCGGVLQEANGAPAVNGTVTIYLAGTNSLANTAVANSIGSANNPNPLVLNSYGRLPAQIWLSAGQNANVVFANANGTVLDVQDNVQGVDDPTYIGNYTVATSAYGVANSAYQEAVAANTNAGLAQTDANQAFALANSAANTVAVSNNGVLVLSKANLNFNNSATVNVAVANIVTILNQADISVNANLTSIGAVLAFPAANGYANLTSNCTVMWGTFFNTGTARPNPFVVTFPAAFQHRCFGVQISLTSNGSGMDDVIRPFSVSRSGFTATYDSFGGTFSPCQVFWIAVGF